MKTYPANVVASITTGKLLCKFDEIHECIQYLLDRPVWTHELASQELFDKLQTGVLTQHPELIEIDASVINKDNHEYHTARINERFGPIELEPIDVFFDRHRGIKPLVLDNVLLVIDDESSNKENENE